jgi:hypothetical protein
MMKTFLACSVHLCFVLFCVAVCLAGESNFRKKNPKKSFCRFSESKEPKRSKLSSVYALTPSLRVGRRSDDSWDPNTGRQPSGAAPAHFARLADVKRRIGKMVSFPRIGRGDSNWVADENNYGAKRPGANSGMWFGPRLGRLQKRERRRVHPLDLHHSERRGTGVEASPLHPQAGPRIRRGVRRARRRRRRPSLDLFRTEHYSGRLDIIMTLNFYCTVHCEIK